MTWHGFRVPVVILAVVLALGLFLGSRWIYYKYSYNEPLNQALKTNEDVESFSIDRRKPVIRITVKLGEVEDIKHTYQSLQNSIQDILGPKPFQIDLQDNRDASLKKIFYDSQFAIYEAIMQGNFREMAESIEREASLQKSQATIFIDQNYIYLQIRHGNHHLYEVIPREQEQITENTGQRPI
ncbi:MAG TPA: hypothetical protein DCK87_08535 [Desulfotomaculum sp.]|nr:hypothetical protein [Desulfotomaculum sp.]